MKRINIMIFVTNNCQNVSNKYILDNFKKMKLNILLKF